jgi:hypothetical protein
MTREWLAARGFIDDLNALARREMPIRPADSHL